MGYNLTEELNAYELVADTTVSSATTNVDFTSLNITKDDDYILVTDISITDRLNIFVNGNTTKTNYYAQEITANGTSSSGSRENAPRLPLTVGVGTYRVHHFIKIKITNNGYFIYQADGIVRYSSSSMFNRDYYGTSAFTVSSITSIRINSETTNDIATGSRFQLYKRVAPLIADIIVDTATTSIDIPVNFSKDEEYVLVSDITNSASSSAYFIKINNNLTNTNYWQQFISVSGTGIIANRENNPQFLVTPNSARSFSIANIKLTNNNYYVVQSNTMRSYGGSSIELVNQYITSTFTSNDITYININAGQTNAIGIGSRFQLFKLSGDTNKYQGG